MSIILVNIGNSHIPLDVRILWFSISAFLD